MKKLFVTTCVLGLLLVGYDIGSRMMWEGSATFEVRLESLSGRRVQNVSFDSLPFRQWADDFRRNPDHFELLLKPVQDFDGAQGTVYVRSSGTSSGLGRELRYVRDELLVLEIIYADGEKRLELAEVPERRLQVISVTIP